MAIKIGSNDISTLKFGEEDIKSVCVGDTEVWTAEHDDFIYDEVIPMPASGELDFVYTSDIHVGWKDFGSSRWGESFKTFSLDVDQLTGKSLVGGDVKAYQNKLIAAGIPTYLLDCGDWSKSAGETDSDRNHAIDVMKNMNYFGITSGNWEFKWSPISTAFSYLNKLKGYGMMSINICDSDSTPIYAGGINPQFPGAKFIKVGKKKIAVIGISYPSPNGFDTYGESDEDGVEYNGVTYRWNYKQGGSSIYRFKDSSNDASLQQNRNVSLTAPGSMYGALQNYVNTLKNDYGFDYVIAFGHMDKYTDENYSDDSRFYSRADFLIMNTTGLDAFIPGHLNTSVVDTYEYVQRDGVSKGIVAPEAGGTMNSFGRLKIDLKNDKITCKLLQSVNDLKTI